MSYLSPVKNEKFKYSHIIGTGGIGSGMFFKLEGDHTLGRNESRLGELVPFKDYCKLHIIFHYIAVFTGAVNKDRFTVNAIGAVGKDEIGSHILNEMKSVGINTKGVKIDSDSSTLFSVCFQYPDFTGGNITSGNSASSQVLKSDVEEYFRNFNGDYKTEMILAVPEVCIDTRIHLLKKGRERGSFNIGSVLSAEINEFMGKGGFSLLDLLAVNIDEAKAIASLNEDVSQSKAIVDGCINVLKKINPDMMIAITDGPKGSYGYYKGKLTFVPIVDTKAIGTSGAGDAFLAGTIMGLCCGLPFAKEANNEIFSQTTLKSALELGTLVASMSVTSPDAINSEENPESLYEFALKNNCTFSDEFAKIFNALKGE